jgi:hypothetical protein
MVAAARPARCPRYGNQINAGQYTMPMQGRTVGAGTLYCIMLIQLDAAFIKACIQTLTIPDKHVKLFLCSKPNFCGRCD